jgi:hypothetical protein
MCEETAKKKKKEKTLQMPRTKTTVWGNTINWRKRKRNERDRTHFHLISLPKFFETFPPFSSPSLAAQFALEKQTNKKETVPIWVSRI